MVILQCDILEADANKDANRCEQNLGIQKGGDMTSDYQFPQGNIFLRNFVTSLAA